MLVKTELFATGEMLQKIRNIFSDENIKNISNFFITISSLPNKNLESHIHSICTCNINKGSNIIHNFK